MLLGLISCAVNTKHTQGSQKEIAKTLSASLLPCLHLSVQLQPVCDTGPLHDYFEAVLARIEEHRSRCGNNEELAGVRTELILALISAVVELHHNQNVRFASDKARKALVRIFRGSELSKPRLALVGLESTPSALRFRLPKADPLGPDISPLTKEIEDAIHALERAIRAYVAVLGDSTRPEGDVEVSEKGPQCAPYNVRFDPQRDFAAQIIQSVFMDAMEDIDLEDSELRLLFAKHKGNGKYTGAFLLPFESRLTDASQTSASVNRPQVRVMKTKAQEDSPIYLWTDSPGQSVEFRIQGEIDFSEQEDQERFRKDCFVVGHFGPRDSSNLDKQVVVKASSLGKTFHAIIEQASDKGL